MPCSLIAYGLPSTVGNQAPTFSYDNAKHSTAADYFGLSAITYMSGTSTCYTGKPPFTPVIQNDLASYTETCSFLTQGSTATELICTDAILSTFPNHGQLTITFAGGVAVTDGPARHIASFGPTPGAPSATLTIVEEATTVTTLPPNTKTVVSTDRTSTSVITVTRTPTVTLHQTISQNSCYGTSPAPLSRRTVYPRREVYNSLLAKRQDTTSTVDPSSTSVDPSTSSDVATSSTTDPAPTTSDPTSTTPDPSSTTPDPSSTTPDPSSTTPDPSSTTPDPTTTTPNPTSTTPDPTSTTPDPTSTTPDPTSTTPDPTSTTPDPTSTTPDPTSTTPDPTSTTPDPSTSSSATPSLSSSETPSLTSSSSATPSLTSEISSSSISAISSLPIPSPTPDTSSSSSSTPTPTPSSSSTPIPIPTLTPTPSSSSSPSPSSTPTPTSSSSSSSSSSPTPSPTPTLRNPSCPADDGQTYSTTNGDFIIECYYDRYNADLAMTYQPRNFAQCMQACAMMSQCTDVSYLPNGPCYLKSGIGQAYSNTNVWGARKKSVGGVSALPVATPTPGSVVCPGSDGRVINEGGDNFQVECGIDRYDADMQMAVSYPGSYEGCLRNCAARSGCVDVSYIQGGPCYLKNGVGAPNRNYNIIGGRMLTGTQSSTSIRSTSTAAVIQCPADDGTNYQSACGAVYTIECGTDRNDNDINGGPIYEYDLNDCISDCDNTPGCVDVSYMPGNPGPCYLKDGVGAVRRNDDVNGARQISGCTSKSKFKLHRKRVAPAVTKTVKHETLAAKTVVKRDTPAPYGPEYTFTTDNSLPTSTITEHVTSTLTFAAFGGDTTTTQHLTATETSTSFIDYPPQTVTINIYIVTCTGVARLDALAAAPAV